MSRESGGGSSSRRRFLAGAAAVGAAAVAGCSGLPFGGDGERSGSAVSLPSDAVGSVDWPASPFPAAVPGSLADAHESRTRSLLDDVPAEPEVPNAEMAAEIGADRERARKRTDSEVAADWPVDALSAWRRRRRDAAAVRGAYRAATGVDDGADLAARRSAVRDARAALASEVEYRAESPVAAALAYEPVELLLAECERHVRPEVTYPADPVAEPFRAGEATARVERAEAAADDAEGLRSAYLDGRDGPPARWASLIAVADGLRASVSRTRSTVRERAGGDEPLRGEDLSGTVAQELVATGDLRTESAVEDIERAVDAGNCATAVVGSGVALTEIDAFRAAVDEIRDGEHRGGATEASVRAAAERARTSVEEAVAGDDPLATRLVRPGLDGFEYVADRVEEGYSSARRTQATLEYVALYAGAVPAASEFVRERLA
ncbi:twin-arginine translocation signal domain-containing protein [Halorubrum ejinorense]|uniref:Twin-arginine translocation signal domain-containing protein n=1 Tax=Halorubrum ejinorense TaxID=425309 RepID=A0AAV3ST35_9EURY